MINNKNILKVLKHLEKFWKPNTKLSYLIEMYEGEGVELDRLKENLKWKK